MSSRGRARLLPLVLLAALPACGSTVAGSSGLAAGSAPGGAAAGEGLAGPAAGTGAPVTTDGGSGAGAPLAGGTAPGAPAQGGAVGGAPAASAGGAAPAGTTPGTTADGWRVRLGQGVTATTVKIGIIYSPNLNDAQKATGSDNLQTGDSRKQDEALFAEINRTGGLGGRKIVIDEYAISATTSDAEQAYNAACAHFVQDTKVFAVLTAGPESFGTCLEKGGVLQVGSDLTNATRATTALQPHGLRPAGIPMEDAARLLVTGLQRQGYFAGSVVGVITFDAAPYQQTIKNVMLPALSRIGHPAKDTFYVSTPNSASDYGTMSSSISSAVLRFRGDGITHVIIFDQQGRITTFFVPGAQSQGYKPRYGFTSQAGFQVGVTGGSIPPDQANGAAGIGWLPAFDVPVDRAELSPGAARCDRFFTSKGMTASGENAMVIQQFQCQDAWLLDSVMDRLTTDVARDAFVRAAESAGTLTTAANLGIAFDRSNHDGVRVVRDVGWNRACGCFRYVGGNRPIR